MCYSKNGFYFVVMVEDFQNYLNQIYHPFIFVLNFAHAGGISCSITFCLWLGLPKTIIHCKVEIKS